MSLSQMDHLARLHIGAGNQAIEIDSAGDAASGGVCTVPLSDVNAVPRSNPIDKSPHQSSGRVVDRQVHVRTCRQHELDCRAGVKWVGVVLPQHGARYPPRVGLDAD